MNSVIQLEDRVSRSRSKHEGESSAEVCDRLSRTRVSSQRQLLLTDHDYAVPTREYQLDQSSPLPATAAADPVLEVQRQKPPQRFADIGQGHTISISGLTVIRALSPITLRHTYGAHKVCAGSPQHISEAGRRGQKRSSYRSVDKETCEAGTP